MSNYSGPFKYISENIEIDTEIFSPDERTEILKFIKDHEGYLVEQNRKSLFLNRMVYNAEAQKEDDFANLHYELGHLIIKRLWICKNKEGEWTYTMKSANAEEFERLNELIISIKKAKNIST